MDWSQAEAALELAVASVFDGQEFALLPTAEGQNGPGSKRQPDPERAAFSFRGTLELGPPPLRDSAQYPRSHMDMPAGERGLSHHGVISANSTAWPWKPEAEDRILPMNPAGAKLIVAAVLEDGSARLAIYVNKVRTA